MTRPHESSNSPAPRKPESGGISPSSQHSRGTSYNKWLVPPNGGNLPPAKPVRIVAADGSPLLELPASHPAAQLLATLPGLVLRLETPAGMTLSEVRSNRARNYRGTSPSRSQLAMSFYARLGGPTRTGGPGRWPKLLSRAQSLMSAASV